MLICAALSKGSSSITNILKSEDISLTTQALSSMGANISRVDDNQIRVDGFGGIPQPYENDIYLGNSGTSMRLLAGICGLGSQPYTLTGNERMRQRPMVELLDSLTRINIKAAAKNDAGTPPVTIHGTSRNGGNTRLDCSRSSQYLSSLLMIGPFLENGLTIDLEGPPVSSPYIDLTIDVMNQFNVTARKVSETRYEVPGGL